MRAAVYHGRRDVRIEEVSDPPDPGPGEVVLEVLRAGICGTDASEWAHGPHHVPLETRHPASGHVGPVVLGHEIVGRVVAAGAGVEIPTGARVVPGAGIWCGRCPWCRAGRTNLCASYYTLGLQAAGGLAGLVRAPARICLPVVESCSDDAAGMAQPLAVALHAVRRSRAAPGESIAVIGAGGIGAFIIAGVRALGLEAPFVVDVDPARLTTALRLGAAAAINARDADAASEILAVTAGQGAEVVIEASGSSAGLATALQSVRRGGRLLLVGLQAEPQSLDLHPLVIREVEILTTNAHICDVDLPQSLEVMAATDLGPTVLDGVIGLEALVDQGLRRLAAGEAKGKILVDPRR